FVAARLGDRYTAEEQISKTTDGGLQLEAVPIKPEIFFEQELKDELPRTAADILSGILRARFPRDPRRDLCFCLEESGPQMGLSAGGKMKQTIYEDPWAPG